MLVDELVEVEEDEDGGVGGCFLVEDRESDVLVLDVVGAGGEVVWAVVRIAVGTSRARRKAVKAVCGVRFGFWMGEEGGCYTFERRKHLCCFEGKI